MAVFESGIVLAWALLGPVGALLFFSPREPVAVQALSDSWAGSVPETSNLLVMAAYAGVAGLLAVWFFRWD